MDLSPVLHHVRRLGTYKRLLEELRDPTLRALQAPRALRIPLTAALHADLNRPILLLVARSDRLLTFKEELLYWDVQIPLHILPDPGPLYYEWTPWPGTVRRERAATLAALTQGMGPGAPADAAPARPPLVLATARGAMTRTISRQQFLAASRYLKPGAMIRFAKLIELLVDIGYAHQNLVTEPGEFSRRGGILDLWPPLEPRPVRIEFFGDQIETLRSFDPSTQRTLEALPWIRLAPAREGLPRLITPEWWESIPLAGVEEGLRQEHLELLLPPANPDSAGPLDFLPEDGLVLLEDRAAFEQAVEEIETTAISMRKESESEQGLNSDFPLPYLPWSAWLDLLESRPAIDLGRFAAEPIPDDLDLAQHFTPGPRFGGQIQPILAYLEARRQEHESCLVLSRQAPRLAELWSEEAETHTSLQEQATEGLMPGGVAFIQGALSEGWILQAPDGFSLHLLTDAELFGWSRPRPRRRSLPRPTAPEEAFADLSPGDFVVHTDYGIGRFAGLVQKQLDGIPREFLLIEYAEGDQLFVPIHQADRISRYVGADGGAPSLSRLGTSDWERAKEKTRQAVEEVARDLLELYARRQAVSGHAFSPDTPWQRELEASFIHQETEDQFQALAEIKRDMERPLPMDRLICGDVGYGKTEVALRAAFKAVMDGKQVAMLVPTTVLAQQHFHTFRRRLAAFPVEVEMLSRFRSPREANEIIERLRAGEIDIIIGTHRLLQSDVGFKDLGLLIIDEEQRFGVTHKEFLKQLRTEVDVLTLTATPIPRTLYMALTGARDISTISTPPEDRLPVITHVGPYDPKLVRAAVMRELDRGGQVFFVHNRVQTINTMRCRLERLIPEAQIAVAHGQMPEQELSAVMEAFSEGEIDVLVSTSIIESGLDIPSANTLIVDRADQFGLAQLYQLRGRVGRAAIQGYAYFFRPARSRITDEALQRLDIIAEHSQLGAGYAIAMRDLEMRGAGEILGTRQHGYIASVGFHLYTRLLASAVARIRRSMGKDHALQLASMPIETPPAIIDLPLPSAIPESYIPSRELRLQLYRRLASLDSLEAIRALNQELEDRFGPPPEEIENLLYQLEIKTLARGAGVERISAEGGQILIEIPEERDIGRLERLSGTLRRSKRGLWLPAQGRSWKEDLRSVLRLLKDSDWRERAAPAKRSSLR